MLTIKKINVGGTQYEVEDAQARADLQNKEDNSNKTQTIANTSTTTQYPSAKATYDAIEDSKTRVTVTNTTLEIANVRSVIDEAIGGSY